MEAVSQLKHLLFDKSTKVCLDFDLLRGKMAFVPEYIQRLLLFPYFSVICSYLGRQQFRSWCPPRLPLAKGGVKSMKARAGNLVLLRTCSYQALGAQHKVGKDTQRRALSAM